MVKKVIGWVLLVVASFNLIFSLFFTFGESFISHIPAILFSVLIAAVGYGLIRRKSKVKEVNNA